MQLHIHTLRTHYYLSAWTGSTAIGSVICPVSVWCHQNCPDLDIQASEWLVSADKLVGDGNNTLHAMSAMNHDFHRPHLLTSTVMHFLLHMLSLNTSTFVKT